MIRDRPRNLEMLVVGSQGLPCVSGTRDGTVKIKTGDSIRVDGDKMLSTSSNEPEAEPVKKAKDKKETK